MSVTYLPGRKVPMHPIDDLAQPLVFVLLVWAALWVIGLLVVRWLDLDYIRRWFRWINRRPSINRYVNEGLGWPEFNDALAMWRENKPRR